MKERFFYFILFVLAIVLSCKKEMKANNINMPSSANISETTKDSIKTGSEDDEDMRRFVYSDTATIQNNKYEAIYNTINDEFIIIRDDKDTIYRSAELGPNLSFEDFDEDGNKDILITYMGNISIHDLLLFDEKRKKFVKVDNFIDYPDSKRIENTKFYYSYHRSGCADMNWDSDLFCIKNFKTYKIGNISGEGCEYDNGRLGIYIYKIKGKKEHLIEKKGIDTINNYEDYKWGFIKEYWENNYHRFSK